MKGRRSIWIHYVMKAGANHTVQADDYVEYPQDGYEDHTKEDWDNEIRDICVNMHGGDQFTRGFKVDWEIVQVPSIEWIRKKAVQLHEESENIKAKLDKYQDLLFKSEL